MLIIDNIIFNTQQLEILEELVIKEELLKKIWCREEELKFILYNVYANVALSPEFMKECRGFLSQIRMELAL